MANSRQSSDDAGLDMSQVRPPAKLAISGIEQVMDVLLYGTLEVKQYLAAECDLIFECRICRALFRSLPNFIGHKRMYCTEKMKMELLFDDGERSEETDSPEEIKLKERALEKSLSTGKGMLCDDGSLSKQNSCSVSPSGPSTGDATAEKVGSGTSRSKQKSSNSVIRPAKTVQQVSNSNADVNGKLTYADVVDFVKKTCKLCGMKAPERRHLVEHARNTHADRLYFLQCPHCPCSFFITGNLTRHLKNAHNVDAKAADVTTVLPGMNTHAMSLVSLANKAKSTATQHPERRGGRTTLTGSSRKRPAQNSSNVATTSTASDNSPSAGGSVRNVPQRKPPLDLDVSLNHSETKAGCLSEVAVKSDEGSSAGEEEEEDDLSLAAMANKAINGQSNGLDEDSTLASSASKVPEAESKSVKSEQATIVLRSRSSRSCTSQKTSNDKQDGAYTDMSPQVAPPAAKLARLEFDSQPRSSSSSVNNSDDHLRGALTSAAANVVSRSLRKGAVVTPLSGESAASESRSAAKSIDGAESVRSTRRLSLTANPVQIAHSTEVLDFQCRKCKRSFSTLAECASHVQSKHGLKVDRRDPQLHIEVCRSEQSTTKLAC